MDMLFPKSLCTVDMGNIDIKMKKLVYLRLFILNLTMHEFVYEFHYATKVSGTLQQEFKLVQNLT